MFGLIRNGCLLNPIIRERNPLGASPAPKGFGMVGQVWIPSCDFSSIQWPVEAKK
ncbi:hypothetical protein QNI19_19575 [Cytophagaceae bacterium DM2B3-1]|uniref:Uncharacterized protein n=1 Tax=Xanthocytophaga flava TaxID=3048013 RepID=A0ABT7CN35_9BACT|nr:hypothetical protein [Xanthocytophaga flavus]MDJ1495149.1 hypothetical protein [Xanthocytophaga flavus]